MRTVTVVARRALALGLAGALAACSLPPVDSLPARSTVVTAEQSRMELEGAPPVVELPVGRGILVARSVRDPMPPAVAARRIAVSFPAGEATLDRLITMISYTGVRVATRFETASDVEMLRRPLPVRSFSGTFAELAGVLEAGMGVVTWWQNGTMFLSDRDRYAFTVPQNGVVIDSIMADLKSLGAVDITQSLRGGQIVFTAPPSLHNEVIRPYMDRIHRNMAMVKVQVAVVSLTLTDQSASGFDWNALTLQFNQPNAGTGTTSSTGTTNGGTSGGTAGSTQPPISFRLAQSGHILGISGVFNVTGAISFLSRFGSTDTRQNVEVHTLSGAEVTLRSGQTIPYVSGVGLSTLGTTSVGTSGIIGSAQTTSVQTGLTVKLTPFYDADTRVVTADLNVLVNSVLEFRELSAGNQLGVITQPVTQEQSLNDIVRVLAGNTVVLGGLQVDGAAFSNNDPTVLRQAGGREPSVVGKRAQDVSKQALFIILRPTVTVFREGGG